MNNVILLLFVNYHGYFCIMAIKYLKNSEIDKTKWDNCINSSANCLIYGNSWYLDIVCENWDALILDDYKAVMPLPWKSKWGIKYIYHPFFAQQLGIFFTEGLKIDTKDFLKAVPKHFLKYDFALNHFNNCDNIRHESRNNFLLPLNKTYKSILSEYDGKCRRNIKLSKKEDVTINTEVTVDTILEFKRSNMVNSISNGHFNIMKKLLHFLIENNRVKIVGAFNSKNELLGAAAFVFYKKRIIYLFSASNPLGKKKRVMYRIIDYIIENSSGNDVFLDFEGSMIDGIARFFKGFGSVVETYYRINKSRIPFIK